MLNTFVDESVSEQSRKRSLETGRDETGRDETRRDEISGPGHTFRVSSAAGAAEAASTRKKVLVLGNKVSGSRWLVKNTRPMRELPLRFYPLADPYGEFTA
jgi:hypothetical protein